ncbi:MAG: glycosyltransferase family 2 protein [Verrucomicrobiota bacterium]
MNNALSLGVVVNTYNQPDYLLRVLQGLGRQSSRPSEILVADDGSSAETRRALEGWSKGQPTPCRHVWQEKQGFRRSRILNQAIAQATADYLVFLDGDSIPHPKFVADHQALAERGCFIQGHRALIERRAAAFFGLSVFASDRRRALWTGQVRGLKHAFRWPRPLRRFRCDLRGVRGCNLAIWRSDLVRVNGYNEEFVGWGREDSELSLRLINSGVRRVDVRGWAICYHLWHPPVSREGLTANDQLLAKATNSQAITCSLGLAQHLPSTGAEARPARAEGL